jgi:hypothetical protein
MDSGLSDEDNDHYRRQMEADALDTQEKNEKAWEFSQKRKQWHDEENRGQLPLGWDDDDKDSWFIFGDPRQ